MILWKSQLKRWKTQAWSGKFDRFRGENKAQPKVFHQSIMKEKRIKGYVFEGNINEKEKGRYDFGICLIIMGTAAGVAWIVTAVIKLKSEK